MTQAADFLIVLGSDRWRVARLAGASIEWAETDCRDDATGPEAIADLASILREWEYQGRGVVLALPADWILAAPISCDDLPRKERQLAMLYRLEEQLPLEAEGLTAAFAPAVAGHTLAAAVQTDRVAALLERITVRGIEVESIRSIALLAAWEASTDDGPSPDYLLIPGTDDSVEILRMVEGLPARWYSVHTEAELRTSLGADMLTWPTAEANPSLRVVGATHASLAEHACESLHLTCLPPHPASTADAAAVAAAESLSGKPAGWIDFRRDALAQSNPWGRLGRLVTSAVVLVLLLLTSVIAVSVIQSRRCSLISQRARSEQVTLYRKLFPNRPAPASVLRLLQSEIKLHPTTDVDANAIPPRPCAFGGLRRVMEHLPTDIRLRLTNMQIDPTGVLLDGQALSHGDAESIARRLENASLNMDPPHTERFASGAVSFTAIGRWVELLPEGVTR